MEAMTVQGFSPSSPGLRFTAGSLRSGCGTAALGRQAGPEQLGAPRKCGAGEEAASFEVKG